MDGRFEERMRFCLQFLTVEGLIAAVLQLLQFHAAWHVAQIYSLWFVAEEEVVDERFEWFDDGGVGCLRIAGDGWPHE